MSKSFRTLEQTCVLRAPKVTRCRHGSLTRTAQSLILYRIAVTAFVDAAAIAVDVDADASAAPHYSAVL